MVARIFSQRCILITCPNCGKMKKHGRFILLTTEDCQKLSQRYTGFDLIMETCPECLRN